MSPPPGRQAVSSRFSVPFSCVELWETKLSKPGYLLSPRRGTGQVSKLGVFLI